MTSQPDRPEQEQQAGEEPEYESLLDDPAFYRGNPQGYEAEYFMLRNRGRVIQSWVRGGISAKGVCILFVTVIVPLLVWSVLSLE